MYKPDTVDKIISYENGDMNHTEVIDFFAELIASGLAWTLQGSYGRSARCLIDNGFIAEDGAVLRYPEW